MPENTAKMLVREGLALVERKAYAEALQRFEQAVALEPVNLRALFCLGAALYHLGRMDDALQYWRRVHDVDPTYAEVDKWLDAATQQAAIHDDE